MKQGSSKNKENVGVKNVSVQGQKSITAVKESSSIAHRKEPANPKFESKGLSETKTAINTTGLKVSGPNVSKCLFPRPFKDSVLKTRNENIPKIPRSTKETLGLDNKTFAAVTTSSEKVTEPRIGKLILKASEKKTFDIVTVPASVEKIPLHIPPPASFNQVRRKENTREQERKEYLESVRRGKFAFQDSPHVPTKQTRSIPIPYNQVEPRVQHYSPPRWEELRQSEMFPGFQGLSVGFNPVSAELTPLYPVYENMGGDQFWPTAAEELRVTENNVRYELSHQSRNSEYLFIRHSY